MDDQSLPRYYTREELSIKIGKSVSTINSWLYYGQIPHYRLGPKVLFTDEHVAEIKKITAFKSRKK